MAASNPSARPQFPVQLSLPVRFRHIDAMGHVNNAVFLSYFEDARVAYHQALAGGEPFAPTDFDFILAQVTTRSITARA